jgi:hypothetical protein
LRRFKPTLFLVIWAVLMILPSHLLEASSALTPPHSMTLGVFDPSSALDAGYSESGPLGVREKEAGAKSRVKALALSALLPGAGQYYAGKKGRANFFFLAESAIWTSFVVFEVQGYLRKGNYRDYAELMTGVDTEDKSDEFLRIIGQYMQSDPGPGSYNESIRREARALYPDDRERQEQYLLENGYFGDDAWQWQSEEDQARYRDLRKKSQLSFRRATYMLGLAIANRILSAMDAARSVSGSAEAPREPLGLRFEMRPDPEFPSDVVWCLSKSF